MSETRAKVSLDAALGAWPDVEKTAAEWEDSAQTVEAQVRSGARGTTAADLSDEDLLSAPLGQVAEDGHNSASPAIPPGKGAPMTMQDRERDRRSLQDLAKLAHRTPPPPSASPASGIQRAAAANEAGAAGRTDWARTASAAGAATSDDSGIVDLAAAVAADPGADQRAQTTPLASQGLFDDEPASVRPPPSDATESATSSKATALPAGRGNGKVIAILLSGVVAAAAVAAGVVVYAKHKHAAEAAALAAKSEAAAPAKVDAPRTEPGKVAQNDTRATAAPLDPGALAAPAPNAVKVTPKAAALKGGGGAAPAAKSDELKLAQKDLPQPAGGPAGDLGDAILKAAGPKSTPEQTPAAGTSGPQFVSGSVPQKPSQGAITGAIGSVLPGARACLGPDDPVSYASITFASAGNVQSVTLSGGAAGKPAERCIKGALMKARVAPFAEATYMTRVPVRP